MKNLFLRAFSLMVMVLSLSFLACERDSPQDIKMSEETSVDNSMMQRTIGGLEVMGSLDSNGDFVWETNKATIISNLNSNINRFLGISPQFTDLEFDFADGEYVLRATGNTSWTSTILLNNVSNSFTTAEVTCTSSVCADSDTECVPKPSGKSCTRCGQFTNHCSKTVTIGSKPITSAEPELDLSYTQG